MAEELNDRQKRFCEAYAANGGNATEAAKAAGYSAKTARQQGQRLLTNVVIMKYIRQLQDEVAKLRIASMTAVKAYWSGVMQDGAEKTADRLKASELLAKSAGAFLHSPADVDGYNIARAYDGDGDDVIIYIPQMDDEKDHLYVENEGNEA